MALNRKLISLGATISFTVDGAAITNEGGATVSSRTVKPDGTTPADWAGLTRIEKLGIETVTQEDEVMAPAPGAYRRVDKFRSMLSMDLKFSGIDVNEYVFQSVFQCGPITNATPFVPQSKLGQIYGWMKIEGQSQNDNLVLDIELYGILTVKGLNADGKRIVAEFEFAMLHNEENEGTSTLAAA